MVADDLVARRPSNLTLAAFLGVALLGGANVVTVRLTVLEFPPFFGAGTRFLAAALLMGTVVIVKRLPLPRGSAFVGAVLYGLLGFWLSYALLYWALTRVEAGVAAVVIASVPLLTLFFVALHGLEKFRLRGLFGGLLAVVGIAVLLGGGVTSGIPLAGLAAVVVGAAAAAESGVLIKRFPPSDPLATNAFAMAVGGILLLGTSAIGGEPWVLPASPRVWLAFAYLIVLGSIVMFVLYLYVIKTWTASGASYAMVLMPIVAIALGALIAGEHITPGVVLGATVVIGGVYVGALSSGRVPAPRPPETEVLSQRCSSC